MGSSFLQCRARYFSQKHFIYTYNFMCFVRQTVCIFTQKVYRINSTVCSGLHKFPMLYSIQFRNTIIISVMMFALFIKNSNLFFLFFRQHCYLPLSSIYYYPKNIYKKHTPVGNILLKCGGFWLIFSFFGRCLVEKNIPQHI